MSRKSRITAILISSVLMMAGLSACNAQVNLNTDNNDTNTQTEDIQPQPDIMIDENANNQSETSSFDEMTEEDTAVLPEIESVPFDMNVFGKDGDYKVFESYGNSYLLTDLSSRDYPQLADALKKIDENEKAEYKKTIDANLSDAEEFAKQMQQNGDDYSYMSYSETQLITCDDKIVSMLRTEYGYLGGAHPDYYYETFNLYSKTGENIPLSDVITDDDKLEDVLEDKLNREYPDGNFFDLDDSLDVFTLDDKKIDSDDDFKVPDRFTMSPKGLVFYFGPYDLNSYADGTQQIEIQYSEIADILKPGFIYEDQAKAGSTEDTAPAGSSAKNDLAVSAPGFTGLTNIRNENNEDGSYFYEDMTSDGMTTITNMCAPNSQRDGQAEDAYVTNFVCANIDNDANITEIEFDDDLSALLTNTVSDLSVYEVEWESGSNEDSKVGKGIVLLTDSFTYYYGFRCPLDYYEENEDFYEDELENVSLLDLK